MRTWGQPRPCRSLVPKSDIGRAILLRCGALFAIRNVLGCAPRPEDGAYEATRVHIACRRRGGGVAGGGACTADSDASHRVP
jgi:hypothetical protein